jgi:polyhydroxybutyrate depolymerase
VVGGDRPVTVRVPPGYASGKPAPLLVLLHGYGGSGKDIEDELHLGAAAAQRGYLSVAPDGTLDSTVSRFWNATDACCDFEGAGVDDATYLENVIKEVEATFTVDPKRIDVVGHSNGAFMSYAMACTHADTIAAIVSLAGATFKDPKACAPKNPVAVLQIHGTTDDTIDFDGGAISLAGGHSMGAYPGARATVATWAKYDGCTTSAVVDEHVDVDATLGTAAAPAEATVTRWSGCKPGGAVELWTVPGGNHTPTVSAAFPGAVLDFLEAHPKP